MFKNRLSMMLSALILIGGNIGIAAEQAQETAITQDYVGRLDGLEAMVNNAMETFHIPGAAVGIIIDSKVVFVKGFGIRTQEGNLPVTEDTLFAIGSCTKAFTTHVLGQLVDEGKVSWDDPVIKYLPEFRLKDEHATYHMTIRDLVTHQSGLPRHDFLWYNSDLSRNDLLPRLQYLDSTTDLRGKFQYNNLMYVTAGIVIERITGQTWEEAVQSRILTPLGMNRSNLSVLDSQKSDDFSFPFREKNGVKKTIPFNNIKIAGPAGSINSSVTDMMKWMGLQLSDGTFEGRQFLKKETLRSMHTPQVALRLYPEESWGFFGYGLGWATGMHQGHYIVGHGGGIDGFISSTAFLPNEKIGVVVLSNTDSSGEFASGLASAILSQILGVADEGWALKAYEKEEQMKAALMGSEPTTSSVIASLIRPLADYVGEFEHPAYGTVQIHKEAGNLILVYHDISVSLSHKQYDCFTGALEGVIDMPIDCFFVTDRLGEISELNLPWESTLDPILFKRKPSSELLTVDYLKRFEGVFENSLCSLVIVLKGNQLVASTPGTAGELSLIPEKSFQFSLKGTPSSKAKFMLGADGEITELLFITPHGTTNFKVKPENEDNL